MPGFGLLDLAQDVAALNLPLRLALTRRSKAARPLCQQTVNLAWAAIVPTTAASQPASDLFDNLVGKDKNSLW